MKQGRTQSIPGAPTRTSIVFGAVLTGLVLAGTVHVTLTGDPVAIMLAWLASVLMTGQTAGQAMRYRAVRGVVVVTARRIECPHPECDGATMSQAAMDVHLALRHPDRGLSKPGPF